MFTKGFHNLNTMKMAGSLGKNSTAKFSSVSVGTGQAFKLVMENIVKQVDIKGEKGLPNLKSLLNRDDLSFGKGMNLIDKLAPKIKLNGMSPEILAVDEEGLSALGELLMGFGFDQKAVEGFLADLKGEKSEVALPSLFDKLGKFIKENDAHETMELSALPYFESMLSTFDIKPEVRENLMKKALNKGDKIDLEELVAGLTRIDQKKGSSAVTFSSETKLPAANLMTQGLGLEEEVKGPLSLNDFISKLKAKIEQNSGKVIPEGVSDSLADTFAENIHLSKKAEIKGGKKWQGGLRNPGPTGLNFDKQTFQHQQHLSEDSFEERLFNGKMGRDVRVPEKFAIKDQPASFEKVVKDFAAVTKEIDEAGVIPGKTAQGHEILQKVAGLKSSLPTEKTLPSYVTDQVARQITNAVRNGESEVKFQIKPPELGRLELSIETTKSGLKISILAEQSATRDMLISNTGELRTLLSEHGIRLEKIDVDISGNFGQSMANARQEADTSGKGRKGRGKSEFSLDQANGEGSGKSEVNPVRYRKGNLDLVA